MRDWPGAGQWICGWYSTRWMQCSVCAALGDNSWSWQAELERDDLTLCSVVMVELKTTKREMRGDEGNHYVKLVLREFCVQVNWPSPIQQVRVPIWRVVTPLHGLRNPIRQVVALIPNIHSYPPDRLHCHPPSLFLVHNSTITAQYNVKSSLSISPCLDHELTLSTAYTKYSMHQVKHTPSTAYTKYSIYWMQYPLKFVCVPIFLMIMSWPRNVTSASGMPP